MLDTEATVVGAFFTCAVLVLCWIFLGLVFDPKMQHDWATTRGLIVGCLVGVASTRVLFGQPLFGQTLRLWLAARNYRRELATRASFRIAAGEEPKRAWDVVQAEMSREAAEAFR